MYLNELNSECLSCFESLAWWHHDELFFTANICDNVAVLLRINHAILVDKVLVVSSVKWEDVERRSRWRILVEFIGDVPDHSSLDNRVDDRVPPVFAKHKLLARVVLDVWPFHVELPSRRIQERLLDVLHCEREFDVLAKADLLSEWIDALTVFVIRFLQFHDQAKPLSGVLDIVLLGATQIRRRESASSTSILFAALAEFFFAPCDFFACDSVEVDTVLREIFNSY